MNKLRSKRRCLKIINILNTIDKISNTDSEDEDADLFIEYLMKKTKLQKESNNPSLKSPSQDGRKTEVKQLVKRRTLKDSENPLESCSDTEFQQTYRFNKETVQDILQMILYGLTKYTNRGQPVPPILELLITLRFLATGKYKIK